MINKTFIEDLPSELWLDIFAYLNIRDRFNGFFNLNTRLNAFLLNYHYHISLKNNDENSQYLFEHILPQLPYSKYVSSLRLENINKMNLFKNGNSLHFPCLHSLTLCQLHITNDILDLLRYYSPHLQYLNLSSFVSNKWSTLIELVLSLPKLHKCYLYLGIALCSTKSSNLSQSPIRHLTLLGSRRSCCIKSLVSLLNNLPYLNSLHIECDQLECNQIIHDENMNKALSSLSSFSLKVNHLPELFIDFISFISLTMPHVEKLKIKCCNPLLNLVYINVYQWIKLIDLLYTLKELILIITPPKKIEEKAWNRRCEQLIKLTNTRNITLRIISSKN